MAAQRGARVQRVRLETVTMNEENGASVPWLTTDLPAPFTQKVLEGS
jgi:hypothetical protein